MKKNRKRCVFNPRTTKPKTSRKHWLLPKVLFCGHNIKEDSSCGKANSCQVASGSFPYLCPILLFFWSVPSSEEKLWELQTLTQTSALCHSLNTHEGVYNPFQ